MICTQPAPQEANFGIPLRKWENISYKTFRSKTYFIQFGVFIYNFLSKIASWVFLLDFHEIT